MCCWPFKRSIHLHVRHFLILWNGWKLMPNFPSASVSIFRRKEERSCSVLYFTQLNNEPSWHRSPGKYIMSLRDSFLRSLSTPATQGLPFPPVRRVQSPLYSAELYHITPFLSHNLFRAHLHACKSGVLSLGELVGTPWSDSSHPWTLDTLLPWKSHQGCQLIHSLGNSTFISVD